MATLAPPPTRSGPSTNDQILFWASFLTLIAAGIGFSVRGAVLGDWGQAYGFTQSELGSITGGGLAGFGLAIIFFSFFADLFGYGRLMLVAFLLHAGSALVIFATPFVYAAFGKEAAFYCLIAGSYLFAFGNGTCEAVINPLTATLFPHNKTHYLNMLHAGWPIGLVLGTVISIGFRESGAAVSWQVKYATFLIPVLVYGLLMLNRPFPRSEASQSGVSVKESMGVVGGLGFAVAAALIGLVATNFLPDLLKSQFGADLPWAGWAVAILIWAAYFVASGYAPGSLLIAFLYCMHALVGYVELGTDSWINNIGSKVLKSQTNSEIAFIWTNVLMAVLRFFAGPIVHRINPIGLLIVSAVFGVVGLYLLGGDLVTSFWPWMAAVTVYGLSKTFYWPTLLGVISERFPRGGALALGISGGVGMMAAGVVGTPGIGYKQDYFAVDALKAEAPGTYDRYRSLDNEGKPVEKGYPVVSHLAPTVLPKVAGLDNSKVGVLQNHAANLKAYADAVAAKQANPALPDPKPGRLALEDEVAVIDKELAEKRPVGEEFEKALRGRLAWWKSDGLPNYDADYSVVDRAVISSSKKALLYTAAVPALLVVGFVGLYLYFASRGGYTQVHLDGPANGPGYGPGAGAGEGYAAADATGDRPVVTRLPR